MIMVQGEIPWTYFFVHGHTTPYCRVPSSPVVPAHSTVSPYIPPYSTTPSPAFPLYQYRPLYTVTQRPPSSAPASVSPVYTAIYSMSRSIPPPVCLPAWYFSVFFFLFLLSVYTAVYACHSCCPCCSIPQFCLSVYTYIHHCLCLCIFIFLL